MGFFRIYCYFFYKVLPQPLTVAIKSSQYSSVGCALSPNSGHNALWKASIELLVEACFKFSEKLSNNSVYLNSSERWAVFLMTYCNWLLVYLKKN